MIDWSTVHDMAKSKAESYSSKFTSDEVRVAAYNAFHAGYMENAAERESLRSINEELRKGVKSEQTSAEKVEVTNSLDDLI